MALALVITPSVVIPGKELSWSAARSSGPGGQNVNKVATKVELRFDLANSSALAPAVRARLERLAAGRLDGEGRLVLSCDTTRSQSQNLELVRERLAELVRQALVTPKRRRKTKPSSSAKRARVENKRRTGDKKRTRGPASWE